MRVTALALALATATSGCGSAVGVAIIEGESVGEAESGSATTATGSTGQTDGSEATAAADTAEVPPDFSVVLEAEQAVLAAPMEVAADPEASGGEYAWVPGIGGRYPEAEARFAVDVPAGGLYKLWPRVLADHLGSNSFTLEVDGAVKKENWNWVVRSQWHVEADVEVELGAGAHEILIRGREAGTRLDYLVLASAEGEPPPEP